MYILFEISLLGSVTRFFCRSDVSVVQSQSSKVIDFVTNQKRACDFLLVRHTNNFGLILQRFADIAGFCAHDPTATPRQFWGVPVGPDRPS